MYPSWIPASENARRELKWDEGTATRRAIAPLPPLCHRGGECLRSIGERAAKGRPLRSRQGEAGLRRRGRQLLRREAAVEGLAFGCHLLQQFRRGEARAVFGFQLVAELDEFFRAHEVDIGQRAAGERREAEAEDRADIGLARVD